MIALGVIGAVGPFAAAPILRALVVENFSVPGASMLPTLAVGDQFLILKNEANRTPERGRVMVFRAPLAGGEAYVKRVVALGGDEVAVRDGALVLNGEVVPRRLVQPSAAFEERVGPGREWVSLRAAVYEEEVGDFVYQVLVDLDPAQRLPDFGPERIPEGQVFFLGDNRHHSFDSRAWGPVAVGELFGSATRIVFSYGPDGVRRERIGRAVHQRRPSADDAGGR